MGGIAQTDSKVPAYLGKYFSTETHSNDDLTKGVSASFPILSYKGKAWHRVVSGVRTLIANEQGDPIPSLEVVIVKASPNISKVFYKGGYVEGSSEPPTCYSHDGHVPAVDATEKQSAKCAICPHNQWGSRITDQGKKGKSCSDSRRLVVAPGAALSEATLLRVPAASLKELVAYAENLNHRQLPYQAVLTRIGFDHTVAHPQLTFKPIRVLREEEMAEVAATMALPVVEQIISSTDADAVAAEAPAAKPAFAEKKEEPFFEEEPEVKPEPPKATRKKAEAKPVVVTEAVDAALEDALSLIDDFDD